MTDQIGAVRPLWPAWALIFAYGLTHIIVYTIDADPITILYAFPATGLAFILMRLGRRRPSATPAAGWWLPIIPLALWMTWHIFVEVFGAFSIPAILFHLQYDLGSNDLALQIVLQIVSAALPFALVVTCWIAFARGNPRLQRLGSAIVLPLFILNPFTLATGIYFTRAYSAATIALDTYYSDPRLAVAPAGKPKNLIRIILESTERTIWHEEVFSDIAAPLKKLEKRGFSAMGIEQAELTGWTLAGMVASDCGVPLFGLGAIDRNEFSTISDFMPNATCLSDLLARDGYRQVFIKGAQLSFSGTDRFLASHNYKEALGFDELAGEERVAENDWGYDDDRVFEIALQRIEQLSREPKPYQVTIQTLGGHSPKGYVSKSCTTRSDIMSYPNETMRAFACTNTLTAEFIDHLDKRGLLNNAVLVVQSDHLAMRKEFYSELERQDRRNTLIIIKEGLSGEVNRTAASMVDVFPTILDAMNYRLPDNRAGLGTSLFSSEPTIVEQFGLAAFDHSILADTALRDRLWGLRPSN
ncbi:sulfatase-like hydrolase/transferase [Ensifer adhaerens]|uniref:sulfatase-like hydrolase/transferase n=1 Tax=Ensifer adhaerens TaxID=106592 RepID=UPI001CC100A7|nr:sulfatase-like hydrolase/transferase [Ensifer adhaerens]MBZ7924633.1 sulfatase-like hydrolase/transferase [Ensifer adhaerens]UAX96136.1 sulfatase-like hydrolase/transferase [Ensifer adhaerens]UAY04522.1 sulfatase-like hydrolase/transferase [Ensifer adhaerens]UAY09954.1 sulfatase-like hydrolase/transferase [Ensifer adhaerens]